MHPTDLTLSDYVDDELAGSPRDGVDEHLRVCSRCRALVAELRDLRAATTGLPPMEPPPGAWTRVESALRDSASVLSGDASRTHAADRDPAPVGSGPAVLWRRRPNSGARAWAVGTWPLAIAALVVAALGIAVFVGLRIGRQQRPDRTAVGAEGAPSAQSVEAELQQAEEHYQKAIAGLEQIASANSGAFDAATAAALQKNLSIVDQAISESRAALRAQPNSEPAQASLLDSFKAKLALLQDTVSLINEMRKGDDAAAARIVTGLKRGT